MRIGREHNVSIFVGQTAEGTQAKKAGKEKAEGKNATGMVFAGNTNLVSEQDLIAQKRAKAGRDAMKIVGDTFAADRQIDDDINERRELVRALKQENLEHQREIDWVNGEQERLKEVYGVTEDSEEQKELELLRKCEGPASHATLEERKQAAAIRERGLTEYQERQLELDKVKKPYQDKLEENNKLIRQENWNLTELHKERLKSNPMVQAQEQAQDIMEAASQEILGMLVEDAKEQIDEKEKEQKEQAEKIKEKREEEEKLLEERRRERKQAEELPEDMPMENMLELDRMRTDVQQEIQEILDKMKLIPEDIKGAAVDEKL